MATEPPATFAEVQLALVADGYRAGAPSALAAEADAGVLAEAACERCGHLGLSYHPFVKGRSYRAFAVCGACGYWTEF